MSTQCRKLARRQARSNIERVGMVKIKIFQSGLRRGVLAPKFSITPMNKQQRILAGLVAEQHIKDGRFSNTRNALHDTRLLSFSAMRKKRSWHRKKRQAA